MTINVYSSIMTNEPDETYDEFGISIEDFVKSQSDCYERKKAQPIACSVNGNVISPLCWHKHVIKKTDSVDIRVLPQGSVGDFFRANLAIVTVGTSELFFKAAEELGKLLVPDLPKQGKVGSQGAQIEAADARANTARLGDAIPELFGEYIRYPDYLNNPRRYYLDTKTQVLELLLCVGIGEYSIDTDTLKIGDTPLDELSTVSYQIFEPGEDLSGISNHENWYVSNEVGSTTGSSGIRLTTVVFDDITYFGSGTGSSDSLTGITVGPEWVDGMTGSIKMTQSITVTDGGGAGIADTFTGNFEHLVAGITVNVESDVNVNGTYVVTTINPGKTEITLETTGGAPVDSATPGSGSMSIDKDATEYYVLDIVSTTEIQVERRLSGGSTDPDWTGNLPQASLTLEIIFDPAAIPPAYSEPFYACPEGETTDEIEVDIFAPNGIGVIDEDSVDPLSRSVTVEWREDQFSPWNPTVFGFTASTRDQLGWTFSVSLPSKIRPQVRVRRNQTEITKLDHLDKLEFTELRSKLDTKTSYDDVTVLAVTITGSNKIASKSNNQINLVATRKLPEISGGTLTAPAATRKISAAMVRVVQSLGYTEDQIDLDALEDLEQVWGPRNDTFNYVFSSGTAQEAIEKILRAGFAEPTLNPQGQLTAVRDGIRTVFEQGYSPENMTSPLQRTFTAIQVDEPDGVEVEYTDAETWTKETVNCFLPGDSGIKVEKIQLDGVTDRDRAWRIGMRQRRSQAFRRWSYAFDTELDSLNSSYLSYVPLLDDVPGYGKVAILESISETQITVSEPLEFEAGKTHVVAYRDEDGTTRGPYTATQGEDEYTINVSIPQPWPKVLPSTQEPTHIYFGTTERWHFPALITSINPGGPLTASVAATNYDARVYDDDDNLAPS